MITSALTFPLSFPRLNEIIAHINILKKKGNKRDLEMVILPVTQYQDVFHHILSPVKFHSLLGIAS